MKNNHIYDGIPSWQKSVTDNICDAMLYGSAFARVNQDGILTHMPLEKVAMSVDMAASPDKTAVQIYEKESFKKVWDFFTDIWRKDNNFAMQAADLNAQGHNDRYRNCVQISCGKSFKFAREDQWECDACELKGKKAENRYDHENALLNANRVLK